MGLCYRVVDVTLEDWNSISLHPEHLIRIFGGLKRQIDYIDILTAIGSSIDWRTLPILTLKTSGEECRREEKGQFVKMTYFPPS